MKKTFLPKKNFKLLFIFLGILFLWTEAAPKGRGGRRRRSGGRRSYQGYRGGGENPAAWVIILIVVVTLGFLACAIYACIKVDGKETKKSHLLFHNRIWKKLSVILYIDF